MRYVSIGIARMIGIANEKKRMLHVVKKNVANANGSKSENWPKHVSVTSKLITRTNTESPELEGYPRILHLVTSLSRGPFPLIRVQAFSRISDQYPLTMEAGSSQASVLYPHTTEEGSFRASVYPHTWDQDNFQASVLCPHTREEVNSQVNVLCPLITEEDSSPDKGQSLLTTEVEHFLVIVLFHLIMAVERCRAPSLFLPTTPGVSCRILPDPSPLITVVVIFQEPLLLPHTTPTRTMGLPTMKSRREWLI
jgi:hypothetical protein